MNLNLSPINRHHQNRVQPPNLTNNLPLQSMAEFWDQASNLHSPMTPNGSDKVVSPSNELSASQSHTPLTPPLTPASSSNDNLDGSNSASSNSSLLYSPAATYWPQAQLHSHIQLNAKETGPIRSSFDCNMQINGPEIAAELNSDRNYDVARDLQLDADDTSGRFLLVTGVPKDITSERLMNEFKECGDIRGIFTRFREQQGAIILAFYDCRQMPHAKQCLDSQTFFGNTKLTAQFVRSSVLKKIVGNSSFMVQAKGELYITVEGGTMSSMSLRNVLLSFGALRNFQQVESEGGLKQTFVAEYSDSRDGQCAMSSLDGRTMLGNRIRVIYRYRDDSISGAMYTQPRVSDDSSRGFFHVAIDQPQSHTHAVSNLQSFLTEKHEEHDTAEVEQIEDMTNSSPFTHRRPLPAFQTSPSSAVSASSLHHATSEQDLRRRAGSVVVSGDTNVVGAKDAALARRTSITFGQDAHRHAQACANATASIKSNQSRPRSISDSSASSPPAQVAVRQPSMYSSENTSDTPSQADVVVGPESPRDTSNHHVNYGMTSSLGLNLPKTPQNSTLNTSPQHQSYISPPGLNNRHEQGDPQTPNMYYPSQIYWPSHSSPLSPMSAISQSPMMPLSVNDFASQSPQNFGIPFPTNNATHEEYAFYHPNNRSIPNPSSGLAPPLSIVADITHSPSNTSNTMSPRSPFSPSNPRRRAPMSPGGRSDPNSNADKGGNSLDIERIAQGADTRTTIMIKNIPNKLNDRELIEYIGKVKPNRIDFLYLRMDFQNGCNVGYAFVNFITVQDLLRFARARLGVKWNMFSSEKVLQMSYATYQGKEALVEKFKNSCVMDERESWRPKIFYSSGPLQGHPEPFPSPTHLRRKERSSQNRGALYVPGPGSGHGSVPAGVPGLGHGYPTVVTANGSGLTMNAGLPSPGSVLVGNPMIAGPGVRDDSAGSHTLFRRSSYSHPNTYPLQSSSYSPPHHRIVRLENR